MAQMLNQGTPKKERYAKSRWVWPPECPGWFLGWFLFLLGPKLCFLSVGDFSGHGKGLDMGLEGQPDPGLGCGQTRSAAQRREDREPT